MADVKRQKQLDVINAKLPAGLSSAPGQPPIKGAQFINGGWLMPRVRKPNPNKEEESKKNELTSNPIPVEELKKMRKEIIAKNEVVSAGPYSSSQRKEPFEFIIIVQVHSRNVTKIRKAIQSKARPYLFKTHCKGTWSNLLFYALKYTESYSNFLEFDPVSLQSLKLSLLF